jgi:outer membrane biosynthesis protein TonB
MAIRIPADELEHDPADAGTPLVLEECTIRRWRGYTRSTFVACLADGTPVAESRAFKCRGDGAPPQAGPVAEAHAQLVAELETLGWARTGEGESWFDVRYGRWVEAQEQPEPDPVEEDAPPELPPAAAARPLPPPLPVHVVREPEPVPVAVPVPAPAAEPEPAPAPAPAPQGRNRRPRRIALVSIAGIVAALGLGGYIAKSGSAKATRTVQFVSLARHRTTQAAQRPAAAKPAQRVAQTPAPQHVAPRPMRLVIANIGHASWLEVRRGSTQGPVLYSGIAPAGATLSYAAPRLWVRFAAAANFRITVDGRAVALTGTVDQLFGR